MEPLFQISTTRIGMTITAILFEIALPLLLGLQGTPALLLPEVIVTVAGLASLWVIWALRDSPETAGVAIVGSPTDRPALAAGAEYDPAALNE